jgi:uncharacterized membrane protein SpoIIM required for sporulation
MTLRLKSYEFRRERERSWRELESVVTRAERLGLPALAEADRLRLPTLYRAALSSLSVARSISLDRALLEYLETLCQRAYFVVYGPRQPLRVVVEDFFVRRFPATVRAYAGPFVLALVTLLGGIAAGYFLVDAQPERYYAFVPDAMANGRGPMATTEFLRSTLYDTEAQGGALAAFSSLLFTHNARIGMFCFALGFAAGVPVILMLLTTGFMLGAMSWVFISRGLGVDWWGWLLPHGVTEMLALLVCAAAGFAVAKGLLFPGARRRMDALAEAGKDAGVLVVGAVLMFLVAGLIEGIFRQVVVDPGARYTLVVLSAAFWIVYLGLAGRGRTAP